MLSHADLGGRHEAVGDGKQPGFAIAMTAPIDGYGFQTKIDGGEMRTGGDAGLPQHGGSKQPSEPGGMLQDQNFVPGIEGDNRLQRCRQVFGLSQHAPPSSSRTSSSQSRS